MTMLKPGVTRFGILLLLLGIFCTLRCGRVDAAESLSATKNAGKTSKPLAQDTNAFSIATGVSTNNPAGKPWIGLSPLKRTAAQGLFADAVNTDETQQVFMLLPGGLAYEGEMRNGVGNGQGTLTGADGTHQWGEFRDGKVYKATGTWVRPDGATEVGTWNYDGTKCGGTITWKDGRVYKGDWKVVENQPELPDGTGTMTWPDGRAYVGEFRDGKMDGRGKMTWPDGVVEEGMWKQDEFVH